MAATDLQPIQDADQRDPAATRPRGPAGLGLSGKLLLLTVPLVMIAAILLYVPAIANFWVNRLNDRVAAANTAALVLDAAPLGMRTSVSYLSRGMNTRMETKRSNLSTRASARTRGRS